MGVEGTEISAVGGDRGGGDTPTALEAWATAESAETSRGNVRKIRSDFANKCERRLNPPPAGPILA